MLSKERQLPAPHTSSAYFNLQGEPKRHHSLANVQMEVHLRAAIEDNDIPRVRHFAEKWKHDKQFEHVIQTLIYGYALQQDAEHCAVVLKHAAIHATPMLPFWMALASEASELLRWIGENDELARYIYLPMPCPNREWCLDHNVDRQNPGPAFRQWWSLQKDAVRQGVEDHLRVEWQRRFIGQPKLYYLLEHPTVEQAVFVATHPQPIWDMPVLATRYPDIEFVLNLSQSLYEGVALRKQMIEFFSKHDGLPPESYSIEF